MGAALRLVEVEHRSVALELPFLVARVPCGFPSPAADHIEEPIDLAAYLLGRSPEAATYVMAVQGASMLGAGVSDGDYVVVSRAEVPRPGHIVVALVDGDRTLKRLKRLDDRLWLVPEAEAPGYRSILVDENVEIWGVVIALARRYA